MFDDFIIISKVTEWDGKSETFVEEYAGVLAAKRRFHALFKELVELDSDYQRVEVIFVSKASYAIETLDHTHIR